MPTIMQIPAVITWAKTCTIRPLSLDGTLPNPVPDVTWIYGLVDIPVQYLIEQGERVIDRSDGVGIIAVHEEDDTLVGADLDLSSDSLDLYVLSLIVGGNIVIDDNGKILQWTAPTITQQRDYPKRFEMDIYSETSDGFLRHRFFYCSGMKKAVNYKMGLAGPNITVKARPNPATGETHQLEFVTQIPNQ